MYHFTTSLLDLYLKHNMVSAKKGCKKGGAYTYNTNLLPNIKQLLSIIQFALSINRFENLKSSNNFNFQHQK